MTDLVEKIARAGFVHWRANATAKGFHMDRPQNFEDMPPDEMEFALSHAHTALSAIEAAGYRVVPVEPTPEMVKAAEALTK